MQIRVSSTHIYPKNIFLHYDDVNTMEDVVNRCITIKQTLSNLTRACGESEDARD